MSSDVIIAAGPTIIEILSPIDERLSSAASTDISRAVDPPRLFSRAT